MNSHSFHKGIDPNTHTIDGKSIEDQAQRFAREMVASGLSVSKPGDLQTVSFDTVDLPDGRKQRVMLTPVTNRLGRVDYMPFDRHEVALLRMSFERHASDPTYGFARSRKGTYVNPAIARDWKWFQLGSIYEQQKV